MWLLGTFKQLYKNFSLLALLWTVLSSLWPSVELHFFPDDVGKPITVHLLDDRELLVNAKNRKLHSRDWDWLFQAGLYPWPGVSCSLSEISALCRFFIFLVFLNTQLLSFCFPHHEVSLPIHVYSSVKLNGTIPILVMK